MIKGPAPTLAAAAACPSNFSVKASVNTTALSCCPVTPFRPVSKYRANASVVVDTLFETKDVAAVKSILRPVAIF